MVHRSYRQRPTYAQQMALKKKADQYVARDGQAPSAAAIRARTATQAEGMADTVCLHCGGVPAPQPPASPSQEGGMREALALARQCIFENTWRVETRIRLIAKIDAALARDGGMQEAQDQSHKVGPDEDPELHAWLTRHQR